MGRLAGPLGARWQAALEANRALREEHRRFVESITPVVHPPAGRRQIALLWYVASCRGGTMMIGWRNSPPLTDDMRALIRKGHLALIRSSRGSNIASPPRTNYIAVTSAGATLLAHARISDADKQYIEMAMQTGVVR